MQFDTFWMTLFVWMLMLRRTLQDDAQMASYSHWNSTAAPLLPPGPIKCDFLSLSLESLC
eukprot:m.8057 g.8057  ORF g.8057 m.8057 type:complete len:60 (+) comp9016_c0_seq4:129-308(+)